MAGLHPPSVCRCRGALPFDGATEAALIGLKQQQRPPVGVTVAGARQHPVAISLAQGTIRAPTGQLPRREVVEVAAELSGGPSGPSAGANFNASQRFKLMYYQYAGSRNASTQSGRSVRG